MMYAEPVAIVASAVFDGESFLRSAGVIVEEGRIQCLDDAGKIRTTARQARIALEDFGAEETTLIPGLIDGHVHLAWGYSDIEEWSDAFEHEDIFAYAAKSARRALEAGITTVRDCGGPDFVTLRLRDEVIGGKTSGPQIIACGPAITTTGGHGDFIGVTADTTAELRERVRHLRSAGVDAIKVMATGGAMDPHTNRRKAQYTREQLGALVEEAHVAGLMVVAHCNASEGIENAVDAGVDTIAHCNWLGADEGTIDYRPDVAKRMWAAGISVDLNIEATIRPLADDDGHAQHWDERSPRTRWDLQGELRENGASVFFTSDEFGPQIARFPALLVRAIKELGISPTEAIHRATAVPARAMGRSGEIGRIAPGAKADLVLLQGLVDSDYEALVRPRHVWQGGVKIC